MCLELTSKIQKVGATKLGLTSSELLIFLFLVSHGNKKLNNIYPSKARISDLCAISVRNIAYINKSLEEKGFIKVLVSSCGKKNNIYTIIRNKVDEAYKSLICPKPNLHGGVQSLHGGDATIAPEQIIEQIINITTTRSINNKDPLGNPTLATPVVVKTLDPEQENISSQLTKWGVSGIDGVFSNHSVDEINRAIRLTLDPVSKVKNFATFFISALKGRWVNPSNTKNQASGDNISNRVMSLDEQRENNARRAKISEFRSHMDRKGMGIDNYLHAVQREFLDCPISDLDKLFDKLDKDYTNVYQNKPKFSQAEIEAGQRLKNLWKSGIKIFN